jgi:hypothetical protein
MRESHEVLAFRASVVDERTSPALRIEVEKASQGQEPIQSPPILIFGLHINSRPLLAP